MRKSRLELFFDIVHTGATLSGFAERSNLKEFICKEQKEITRLREQGGEQEIFDYLKAFAKHTTPNAETYEKNIAEIEASNPVERDELLVEISQMLEKHHSELTSKDRQAVFETLVYHGGKELIRH